LKINRPVIAAAVILAALAGCTNDKPAEKPAPAPQTVQSAPFTVEDTALFSTNARVKAINYTTRQVTVTDSTGDSMTFTAGDAVKRLNEIKAGDTIHVDSQVTVRAEVRQPTPEETADPVAAVAVAGRAVNSSEPMGGGGMGLRVVTTVTAIDQPALLVTLKGPAGDTTTIKARNPDNVRRLKVGDTIILTYIEAVAVSVSKQ